MVNPYLEFDFGVSCGDGTAFIYAGEGGMISSLQRQAFLPIVLNLDRAQMAGSGPIEGTGRVDGEGHAALHPAAQ